MTYIRRAIKYFIQTCLLLAIIIGILMLSGMVSKDISVAFQKRKIHVNGDPALARDGIVEALKIRGYVPESEADGVLKFHLSSPVNRAFRFWEDTITLTPVLGGWEVEGLSRDLVRVVSSIEQYFRNREKD